MPTRQARSDYEPVKSKRLHCMAVRNKQLQCGSSVGVCRVCLSVYRMMPPKHLQLRPSILLTNRITLRCCILSLTLPHYPKVLYTVTYLQCRITLRCCILSLTYNAALPYGAVILSLTYNAALPYGAVYCH